MNLIAIYFYINFNFIGNNLTKTIQKLSFKRQKLYAVCIFLEMAEHHHLYESRFRNLTINLVMFLCVFHGLLKLKPSLSLEVWLFIV